MAPITFTYLTTDHLEDVAALLAARQRQDRVSLPILPSAYEDPAATLPIVRGLLEEPGGSGVVALSEGNVLGYVYGAPMERQPDAPFIGFVPPRSADISDAGYALAPDAPPDLLRRLYGHLAEPWVATGRLTHYVSAPAHAGWSDSWADLEFGRLVALGARSTSVAPTSGSGAAGFSFRQASPSDAAVLQDEIVRFFQAFASLPQFVPFMPAAAESQRRFMADLLADPACET